MSGDGISVEGRLQARPHAAPLVRELPATISTQMANPDKKVRDNVAGAFFVDTTCIDCDTCRQLAPSTFADNGELSFVQRQPETPDEERAAFLALLACPTGSIGTMHTSDAVRAARRDFPLPIEAGVSYCGFTSPKSFGGSSYFVEHLDGNWLVDSPKFLPGLVETFSARGGLARIFLTHQDDVAEAARYAAHFGAKRVIHRADLDAQLDAEIVIEGDAPLALHPQFLAIPTPGHTRGHCALLYRPEALRVGMLFSGDHVSWSRNRRRLSASRDVCWYSWRAQTASMRRLLDYEFEWILPGHGERVRMDASVMHQELERLVAIMAASSSAATSPD